MVTIFTQQKEIPACDYKRGVIVSKKYVSGKGKFKNISDNKFPFNSIVYIKNLNV